MTLDEKIDALETAGYYVGQRDPKRNTDYEGTHMVCDRADLARPASKDAEDCFYCIVDNDLEALVTEAYYDLELDVE